VSRREEVAPVLPLQQAAVLDDVQRYVALMEQERGFSERDVIQQCLLLGEEVGELFKAVRKHENIRIGTTSLVGSVHEELADVLIYLCAIANRLDINLDEALRAKEAYNETISWT
jgi:NTP pyrophosphatase (non-canonical NTP hydrolase)